MERVDVTVTGPYHEPVNAYYGYLKDTNTAVMEMASAAGITISEQKDPMIATTYGVGEMILHAINKGIRNFIIGIGGSATNDGGIGMLKALGFTFLDKDGQDTGEGGQALAKVASVRLSDNAELLSQCNFKIACDVTNPLCGFQGATYIYGPQKGVRTAQRSGTGAPGRCRCRCRRRRRTWFCILKLLKRRTDSWHPAYPECCPS